jgi:hypothetical protein
MSDTIFTRALADAVAAEGSDAALAQLLRVPQNTFSRWISGRAQTPVKAFCKVIDLLAEHERARGAPLDAAGAPPAAQETLHFAIGQIPARCQACDGTQFALSDPGTRLMYTSELRCLSCDARVIRGDLIAQLAKDSVEQSRARSVAREKRLALHLARKTAAAARKRLVTDTPEGG